MALIVTVIAAVLLIGLGALGLTRGVPRGLITLTCTLLAAVVVDLWADSWKAWLVVRLRPENPAMVGWLAATLGFAAVALVLGYGSSLILPAPLPVTGDPPRLHPLARPVAALLGVLNGALIAGYLLRYGSRLLGERADVLINGAPLLRLLSAWLPWFVLALTVGLGGLVVVRATLRLLSFMGRRASPSGAPVSPPGNTVIANAGSESERMSAVSNKINQALRQRR